MPKRQLPSQRILVLMQNWTGYLAGIQFGIAQFCKQRPGWTWGRMRPTPDQLDTLLSRAHQFDGAIVSAERSYADRLVDMKIPIVDISNWFLTPLFHRVLVDDIAVGRMAATHLLQLGLRNFAIAGPFDATFAQLRKRGFDEALAEQGFTATALPMHCMDPALNMPVEEKIRILSNTSAHPIGVFAIYDSAASELLEDVRQAGIRVPEELCMLGVDNDDLVHEFSQPPLSSIDLPLRKIGFEAARLLDRLMAGEKLPYDPLLLPPLGVVPRQSTNRPNIPDNDVLTALRVIRERVHEGLSVSDILEAVPLNRRYLERRFKDHTGRTVLQEILQVRVEKAKELLAMTDLTMPAVAAGSGFSNGERFATVFRELTGQTPTAFRRQFQLRESGPDTPPTPPASSGSPSPPIPPPPQKFADAK